jgi:hypothetical protein
VRVARVSLSGDGGFGEPGENWAVLGDEDVAGFDAVMDDAGGVDGYNGAGERPNQYDHLASRERRRGVDQ